MESSKESKKILNLGTEKINKLLLAFSIPCIISMLINSVYNIVDQIFIGQGVGFLGNAATNVIFPLVILCNAIASLLGNGCAAGLSLRLGEGKKEEAKKQVGTTISVAVIVSVIFSAIAYFLLPKLVILFGCTETVYPYAMDYGRIIVLGAPFMIIYSALSSIIRADGSPKYSMSLLLVGAILNIILDPIFIFTFNMGVKGGALATIIGQIISAIIALAYIPKIKSVDLKLKDFIPNKTILKTLAYGSSSFITQMTILVLFVYMNNILTRLGMNSEFGGDIPLSVYGIISKLNGLYVSAVLGIAIGSQPILGFNYGAGKYDRVKETLKKVVTINFIIGAEFNLVMLLFPKQVVSIFGSADNEQYLKFATMFARTFLGVSILNAFEMTCSIVIQSLGNVKKATFVAFARQILLFLPISFILSRFIGLNGPIYGGPIADIICFIIVIFVYASEYKKIGKMQQAQSTTLADDTSTDNKLNKKVIITISREFGSGGRYVGRMVADILGIKFWDKDLVELVSQKAGMSEEYIESNEQKRTWGSGLNAEYNNDDRLFEAESEAIKEIASKDSCVIIGRCADYILKDEENLFKVFIYSSDEDKVARAVKYYNLDEKNAKKQIEKENKERAKHYKFYTGQEMGKIENYDLAINSDLLGVEKTAELISNIVMEKYNK